MSKRQIEKAKQQKYVFEYYYALGPERDKFTKDICEHFGIHANTLIQWKKDYDWQGQAESRESEIRKRINDEMIDEIAEVKLKYKRMITKLLDHAISAIDYGDLEIKNIKELDTIIKLNMLIDGHATNRVENIVIAKTEEEYANLTPEQLRQIVECEEGNSLKVVGES